MTRRHYLDWLRVFAISLVIVYAVRYLDIYAYILILPAIYGWFFPIWESILCVGLCVGLLAIARRYWDVAKPSLPSLARASYGVFLIHLFVVGWIQMMILPYDYPPFTKFLFVSAVSIPLCFGLVMGVQAIADKLRNKT